MKHLAALALIMASTSAAAQIVPQPGADNPRLQSVSWVPGEEILLTALPGTGLTVMFEQGEQIARVSLEGERRFSVHVSPERDSLMLLPLAPDATGRLLVESDRRSYAFSLQTGNVLLAAILVRINGGGVPVALQRVAELPAAAETSGKTWTYSLRGDRNVRPARITDDGVRTRIGFDPEQPLPGIFAIGPTGEEQAVNGFMRDDEFVIDRVWDELVFRIDKDKASARRNPTPEPKDG